MARSSGDVHLSLVCKKALNLVKGNRKPFLLLVLWGFFLPSILLHFFVGVVGSSSVASIRELFQSESHLSSDKFPLLLNAVGSFISSSFPAMLLAGLVSSAAVFGLVHYALLSGHSRLASSPAALLKKGWEELFPWGIVLCLLILCIAVEQIFLGPIRFFTMFAMMAPVLFIKEKSGVMNSFFSALSLNFVRHPEVSKFSVGAILVGVGMILFLGESVLMQGSFYAQNLDQIIGVKRGLWVLQFDVISVSLIQTLCDIFSIAFDSLVAGFLPLFMVSLFSLVQLDEDEIEENSVTERV